MLTQTLDTALERNADGQTITQNPDDDSSRAAGEESPGSALTIPGIINRGDVRDYAAAIGLPALLRRTGTPVFVLDTDRIATNYAFFSELMPFAELRYALAALPHPAVIRTIAAAGGDFDVVSTGELAMLTHEGVAASGAVYSHPIKRTADILAAYELGVRRFVVDNPAEVRKFEGLPDDARVLVRLRFGEGGAPGFGIDPEHALNLVRFAMKSGIAVAGFSVHLGGGAHSLSALLEDALLETLSLHDRANAELGAHLDTIDVGAGMPAAHDTPAHAFEQLAEVMQRVMHTRVPELTVLAALGRCVAAPAMMLVTSVVGQASRDGELWHYLDDGVHGSFSGLRGSMTVPTTYTLDELTAPQSADAPFDQLTGAAPAEPRRYPVNLAGASTDSIDIIARGIELPPLAIGDALVFPNFGAYSLVMASNFEAIHRTRVHVLRRRASSPRNASGAGGARSARSPRNSVS